MAGSIDTTVTAQKIEAVLDAGLATKFNAIDTEHGDSITLADVAETVLSPVAAHELFPAMVIYATGSDRDHDAESYDIWVHSFVIQFIVVGDTGHASGDTPANLKPPEVLVFRLNRSVRGIIEVLEANRSLTVSSVDNADTLYVDGVDYSDVFVNDEDLYRRDADISVKVQISA